MSPLSMPTCSMRDIIHAGIMARVKEVHVKRLGWGRVAGVFPCHCPFQLRMYRGVCIVSAS